MKRVMRTATGSVIAAMVAVAVAMASCSDSEFSSGGTGTEGARCGQDGSCDPGLVCASQTCVDPTALGGATGSSGSSGAAGTEPRGGEGGDGGSGVSGSPSAGGTVSGGGNGGVPGGGGSSGGSGAPSTGGVPGSSGAAGSDSQAGAGGSAQGGSGQGGSGGAPVQCTGTAPDAEGGRRFCSAGSCYCTNPFDTCFPSEQISACCEGDVDCGSDGGLGGIDCSGVHPIIGPPRTCESGSCLCSDASAAVDSCYPEEVARACCPPNIDITCVP